MRDVNGQRSVGIVGGGAGGLGCAVALAARGVPSVVYEKSTNSHHIDRGDVIHCRSQELLSSWGVWPLLEELGARPFSGFRILDGDGRDLLHLDTARTLGAHKRLWALRHSEIVRGLRLAAERDPIIELRDGVPVDDLVLEQGRVVGVHTRFGPGRHPLTVVCTGSRSALRDQHFGKPVEHDWNRTFYNARLPWIDFYNGEGRYVLDREGLLVMVGLPGGQMRIGLQYVTSDPAARPTEKTFAEHVGRIFRPFADERLDVIEAHSYRLRSLLARRWEIPGAVILGDAAHTVHPTGGQGMNLAFGDAEALAAGLAAVTRFPSGPEGLDGLARAYSAMRTKEVRRVHRRAHVGGVAASATRPGSVAARAIAVRTMDALSPLHRPLLRRLVDVR